jgi:hypothetical protein
MSSRKTKLRKTLPVIVIGLLLGIAAIATGQSFEPNHPHHIDDFAGKPRVVVLTDMGNEPDDQMSFVRLMLYSNEFDLEALIATTSTWQKNKVQPDTMRRIVAAYGEARTNLLKHATGWPEAARLDAMVNSGQPAYGMAAVGLDKMSLGAEAIIRAADKADRRPLWISIWGGANTLAQALQHVRTTRSPAEVDKLIAKLRVYTISDQDDAGPWIRREFPNLHWIGKPSSPDSGEYLYATWTGISGDVYYRNGQGADGTTVTNEWLETNIRAKGPLGKLYPKFAFIMEGDTPAFLGLTNNGLNSYRNPSWGGWGGVRKRVYSLIVLSVLVFDALPVFSHDQSTETAAQTQVTLTALDPELTHYTYPFPVRFYLVMSFTRWPVIFGRLFL